MNIGVAQSERCGVKLHPRTSKVRERKLRQRLLGPRILRSKSRFCRKSLGNAFRISSGSAAEPIVLSGASNANACSSSRTLG